MFSSLKDGKVAHFGLWADETRSDVMAKEALGILATAIERCVDDDVRSAELDEVLTWVEARAVRKHPVACFCAALTVQHPVERKAAMTDAYVRVARELGLFGGRM
jgi:hypothetical protein